MTVEVNADLLRKVIKLAEEKYRTKSIRLQPVPNRLFNGQYQLHIRPKPLSDFRWQKVVEGTLEQILQEVST